MTTKSHGKAKQRARKAARRPASGRDGSLALFDSLCKEILATDGPDLLRSRDPLDAELWASHLIGMFRSHELVGEADAAAAIGGRLVSVARRNRTPAAQVCLHALAGVADGPLRQRARGALRDMAKGTSSAPSWIGAIGTAAPTQAWRATDLCGDQDSVMVGFAYPEGPEHTVVVLIDHALGGIAKDAAVLGPLRDVLDAWQSTADVELVEEPVGLAAGRIVDAMSWTVRTLSAPVTDDYPELEALVHARLAPLASGFTQPEPLAPDEREALVRAFLADPAGAPYTEDPAAWFVLDALVDYRCDYHNRDPLRWSAGAAQLFLLDFVPRKLTAPPETVARVPEVLRSWVLWGAERADLPRHLSAETADTIAEVADDFAAAEGQPTPVVL